MPAGTRDSSFSHLSYQGGPPRMYQDGDTPGELGLGVTGSAAVAVDGTPSRVAGILIAAGAGLVALKLAGFRFNVGVSN